MLHMKLIAFAAELIGCRLDFVEWRWLYNLALTAFTDWLQECHTAKRKHETKYSIKSIGLYKLQHSIVSCETKVAARL